MRLPPGAPRESADDPGHAYSCASIALVDGDGTELPQELASPPEDLGRHTIESGDSKELGELRLWVGGGFVPKKVGSSEGHNEMFLRAAILPDYEEQGIEMHNYNHQWVSEGLRYVARLRDYRYRAVDMTSSNVTAGVERVACGEWTLHEPLQEGQTIRYWLSTQGTTQLQLAKERWDLPSAADVSLDTGPDDDTWFGKVKLTASGESDRGYTLNPDNDDYRDEYEAGDYRMRIDRVELGKGTRFDGSGRHLVADGYAPNVHVLVSLSR